MATQSVERRLAAILFSDIVGYTALMAESEERGLEARRRHRAALESHLGAYRGDLVDENGDELVVIFPSAFDAVNCALAVQAEFAGPDDLRLRIGIHSGDVLFQEGRVYGDGVNVASRIRALAEPGGICVSDEVQHSIQNQANVQAQALGERQLRNVPRAIPVFSISGTALAPASAPARPVRARARRTPRATTGAMLVASLIVAGAAAWWLGRASLEGGEIRSLVVLPLENLSGDPAQEYFVDGMTEALTSNLAKLGALRVISRTSAMRYKGSTKSLPEIADELDVEAVIEGSVVRDGARVRITAQLIHAASDRHLWAESYEREVRSVLALQSEIARAIASAVELELSPGEATRLRADRPVNPAAYEAYLRGRHHWNKRTGKDVRRSVAFFQQAIDADPVFAPAYAGLADAHAILASWFGELPRQAMPRAKAAAERALAIDDTLAEAHTSLGAVKHWYEWDWAGAERAYERAMELNPGYAVAPFWYGELLYTLGRFDESVASVERALELDPLSSVIGIVLGVRYASTGQHDRAFIQLNATLEHEPDFMFSLANMGLAYAQRGDFGRGLPLLRRAVERWPGDLQAEVILAEGLALAGERAEALALIEPMITAWPGEMSGRIARVYAALGERDRAFEWLERAYEERSREVVYLGGEKVWDGIRDDPRFDDLLRRVGIPRGRAR